MLSALCYFTKSIFMKIDGACFFIEFNIENCLRKIYKFIFIIELMKKKIAKIKWFSNSDFWWGESFGGGYVVGDIKGRKWI